MSTGMFQEFIQRFDDLFNKPDISIADQILAPHYVGHFPLMPPLDRTTFQSFVSSFYDAFPDFVMQICDPIEAGDRGILRVTYFGSHRGDFMGIAPSCTDIMMPAIWIFHLDQGLVVESWTEIDFMGVLQQISANKPC